MPTYSNTTNQILSVGGINVSYDSNGNILHDSYHNYTWDAEGKTLSIDSISLTYDALGRMVEQNQSGTYFQIVYSPMGGKFAMMKGQTIQQAFVPLPGSATAEYLSWGLSHYRHPDWLGSERLESSTSHAILQDTAYAPFGEPYAELSGGNGEISFTGQNKDTDWLNYDFMYREHDPRAGRWISPDPAGITATDPTSPQSWNRYAYVGNNPLSNFDPMGTCYLAEQIIFTVTYTSDDGSVNRTENFPGPFGYEFLYPGPCLNQIGCPGAAYSISNGQLSCSSAAQIQQLCESGGCFQMDGSGSAANNGQPQTPQQLKPQQPCYGSNSLTDKAVRFFSLVRLPQTLGEWILGGGTKYAVFKAAQAGATSAGGEESMALPYINGTGAALSLAGMAATGGATVMDARCKIGADVNPIEPVPH